MSWATKSIGYSNSAQVIAWNNLPTTTVIAHLWGAGGGAGGADAGIRGGYGSGGTYARVTFEVGGFDELYIAVGGGGGGGSSNAGGARGGAAGPGFTGAQVYNTANLVSGSIKRQSNPSYVSFLNANGVWYNYGASVFDETRTVNFLIPGVYTFSISCDNFGEIYLDGSQVVSAPGFGSVYTARLTVSAGLHTIRVRGTNTGGPASIAATVTGDFSYGGGDGGNAGGSGRSGGGGGGGGATVLLRNQEIMAIAGGGGGGGGAGVGGRKSNSDAPGNRFFNPGFTAGMNGQNKSGDGGGGGGGGGGYGVDGAGLGGQTTGTNAGDVSGGAGFYGGVYAPNWDAPSVFQFPSGPDAAFTSSPRPGNAGQGGTASGGGGAGGACVLEFRFNSTRIKAPLTIFGNTFSRWRTASDIWIKQNGVWQPVENVYLKHNGDWTVSLPSDNTVPNSSTVVGFFGVNPRPYS